MSAIRVMLIEIPLKYTSEYIANLFWRQEIGKVSSITIIPQLNNFHISENAYIEFHSLCETEIAYEFVKAIKYGDGFKLYDNDDNPLFVQKNTHNSDISLLDLFTTHFPVNHFKYVEYETCELKSKPQVDCTNIRRICASDIDFDYEIDCCDESDDDSAMYIMDEEEMDYFHERYPIRGLGNDYYTIDDAYDRLNLLHMQIIDESSFDKTVKMHEEILHFEKELRKNKIPSIFPTVPFAFTS